jgi:ATP-dependent protease ClpP protease subunit
MSKEKHQFMRVVSEAEDEAVIEIYGAIGGWDWEEWKEINTIKTISEELNRIKALNTNKILVKINSLGGDCDSALTIYDALKDHKAKITTQINGYVASAATIIFMAGDERKVSKNSLFLIHKCSSWFWGNENELESTLDMQRKTNARMLSIYDEGCKKSKDEISALMEVYNGTGKWITADEVLDYGFATEIYNETAKAAAIDRNALKAFKYPPLPAGYDFETEEKEPGWVSKLMQYMGDYFSPINKHNINENNKSMKKLSAVFPLLFAMLAFKTDPDYDDTKGHQFSDEELKAIEAKIAEFNTAKEKFDADKTALETKLTDMTTQRDALQAKVDATPAPNSKQASGEDSTPNAWDDYMKNDPFYKSINQ